MDRLGERIRQLSWELKIPESVLYKWREQAESRPGGKKYEQEKDQRDREIQALEARIAELEGIIGRQTLELDFFRSALLHLVSEKPTTRPSQADQ